MRATFQNADSILRAATPTLISTIIHLVILVILAMLFVHQHDKKPLVLTIDASESGDQSSLAAVSFDPVAEPVEEVPREWMDMSSDEFTEPLELAEISLSSAEIADSIATSLAAYSSNQILENYSKTFAHKIRDARRNGIEIVIVFDSTGSMSGEIRAVKTRIEEIVTKVLEKVPKARFSLVTYRDLQERYITKGVPLTNNLDLLRNYVNRISAQGGGDTPEAVQAGMSWAIENNEFRGDSQKVMLIFGDAPPHDQDLEKCLFLAREFASYNKGVIHTITCQANQPLREFNDIANGGQGYAYTMRNSAFLMEDLLVLAFGGQHRKEVLDFFEMDDSGAQQLRPRTRRRTRKLVGS